MSISSLVIAAKALSVLDSIQNSWPDFTALRNNQSVKSPLRDMSPLPPSPAAAYLMSNSRMNRNTPNNNNHRSFNNSPLSPTLDRYQQSHFVESEYEFKQSSMSIIPRNTNFNDSSKSYNSKPSKFVYNNYNEDDVKNATNNGDPDEWNRFLSPNGAMQLEEHDAEGDNNNDFDAHWTPEPSRSRNNSARFSMTNPEQQFQQSQQNGAMIGTLGRSASTDSNNNDSFSTVIFKLLVSFEDLQKQLVTLLTPPCLALNMLLCRLLGTQSDLLSLESIDKQVNTQKPTDWRIFRIF